MSTGPISRIFHISAVPKILLQEVYLSTTEQCIPFAGYEKFNLLGFPSIPFVHLIPNLQFVDFENLLMLYPSNYFKCRYLISSSFLSNSILNCKLVHNPLEMV